MEAERDDDDGRSGQHGQRRKGREREIQRGSCNGSVIPPTAPPAWRDKGRAI
jgi:hypothetical protein